MKSSTTIISLIGAATAYTIADFVPECAVAGLESGVKSGTPCAVDDLECVCEADNYRATYTAAVAEVLQACGSDTAIGEVLPGAAHMCEVVLSSTFGSTVPSTSAPVPTTATDVPASTTATESVTSITAATTTTAATNTAVTSDSSSVVSSAPSATSSVTAAGATYSQQGLAMMFSLVGAVLAWI